MRMSTTQYRLTMAVLFFLVILTALVALGIGRFSLSIFESLEILWSGVFRGQEAVTNQRGFSVIFNIRIPRILVAMLVGAGLATSGAAFQALFSNPLATADTLGVTAGASFGACLGLLLNFNMILVQSLALCIGLLAMLMISFLGKKNGRMNIIMMILSGIVVSSLFQAFLSLIRYVADPENDLPGITFWLMGSFSSASYNMLLIGAPFILIGIFVLYTIRWKLNLLALPEDEASSLGIDVQKMRIIVIVSAACITAASVSISGQVGWVSLLIPLIARMIFGVNNQRLIPACIGMGAIFMVIIDTLARAATSAEIPLSILTAIVGAPVFIFLLRRTGGIWV